MIRRLILALTAFASLTTVATAENLKEAVDQYLVSAQSGPLDSPWTVTGNLGVTVTDGNSDTFTLTFGVEGVTKWDSWTLKLKLASIYAESNQVQSANEHIFIERLEKAFSDIESLFQELYLEHDDEEKLHFRIQITVGYKRRLIKKEKFEMWGEVGAGVLYEEFRATDDTEAILHLGVNWTWQLTKELLYTQIITFYPSLSNGGEFRMYWESVFSTPIGDRLDLRLSIIDKYDSDAPAGIKDNDIIVALSIAIKFTKE
ncbi:MAG: DUF481 domain-containing protein [Planctomycetota bacterium]|nr:DUF481 domain-containing protein [Planctomycetota bacterium]